MTGFSWTDGHHSIAMAGSKDDFHRPDFWMVVLKNSAM